MEDHVKVIDINRTLDFVKYLSEQGVEWENYDGRIYVYGYLRFTFYNKDFKYYEEGKAYVFDYSKDHGYFITDEMLRSMFKRRES